MMAPGQLSIFGGPPARARRTTGQRHTVAPSGGWRWMLMLLSLPGLLQGADPFLAVSVEPRFFKTGQAPVVQVQLAESAVLDVLTYDLGGRLLAFQSTPAPARHHAVTMDSLRAHAPAVGLFCLVATREGGERLGVYPEKMESGEILFVQNFELDAEQSQLRYFLPRPAWVRVRAGIQDGPYLETLQPWQPQPAGKHAFSWDGTCANGLFKNLYAHPNRQVVVYARALPANVLVQVGAAPSTVASPGAPTPRLPERIRDLTAPPWSSAPDQVQRLFHLAVTEDFRLAMEFDSEPALPAVTVRVDCHPQDRARVLNKRFEIMLFLDTTFIMEDERGLLPFTYRMSTRGIAPGEHVMTLNVIDIEGNLGTVSRRLTLPLAKGGSL